MAETSVSELGQFPDPILVGSEALNRVIVSRRHADVEALPVAVARVLCPDAAGEPGPGAQSSSPPRRAVAPLGQSERVPSLVGKGGGTPGFARPSTRAGSCP